MLGVWGCRAGTLRPRSPPWRCKLGRYCPCLGHRPSLGHQMGCLSMQTVCESLPAVRMDRCTRTCGGASSPGFSGGRYCL